MPPSYLMKKKPELGIKNPYELNADQYAAAVALLQAQRALIGRYWHDAMVQVDDFERRRRRLIVMAVSGKSPRRREEAGRLYHSGRGSNGVGRHDHDACRSQASQLRL